MKKRSVDGLFRRAGSKYWQCWIGGERRSTGCTDRIAARSARARMEQVAADPKRHAAAVCDLQGATEDFLEYLVSVESKGDATLRFYRLKCAALVRHFGGERKLSDLCDSKTWQRWIEERAAVVSRNTVGHELTAAKRVLRVAKMNGAFPFDLDEVFPPRFSRDYTPRDRALSLPEVAALIQALEATTPRLAGFVAWEIATASRWSEVERAEAGDVEADGAIVKVRGQKTRAAAARVPIAPMFRELLLLAVRLGAPTGPLFGRWHNPSRDLEAACKRAGIPKCTTNDLRRTHAQLLNQEGVDIRLIATVLRHSSTKMAEQVYAPMSPAVAGRLIEAANSLPKTAQSLGLAGEESEIPLVLQCPGTESNCRHEDFQSSSDGVTAAFAAGLRGPGRAGSGGLPAKNSTADSEWLTRRIIEAAGPSSTFGPWALPRIEAAA